MVAQGTKGSIMRMAGANRQGKHLRNADLHYRTHVTCHHHTGIGEIWHKCAQQVNGTENAIAMLDAGADLA